MAKLCKKRNMRTPRVETSEYRNNRGGVIKASALGAAAGAIVRNLAPLTKEEHDFFFNSSAINAVKTKVQKVRVNEANKIVDEITSGKLNLSQETKDVFTRSASLIGIEPKNASKYFEGASDAVKKEADALVNRITSVGIAKEHIELTNIKHAAKASRPLAYFVAVGALVAMTGKILVNAFKSLKPENEAEKKIDTKDLTMADVLLDGLGSNTEVLFLTNNSKR